MTDIRYEKCDAVSTAEGVKVMYEYICNPDCSGDGKTILNGICTKLQECVPEVPPEERCDDDSA